jgi:UDP-glucose:(heptosyl)LPS alpha-1,3-glucosyltransferase
MRLALLLFKYFPYGGLQRDFLSLARELQDRGCHCRVYCLEWQGEPLDGVELRTVWRYRFQ